MIEQFDIAVIGAGPAGANAALAAARHGLSVALIDEQPKPGGQVWRAKDRSVLSAPQTPESVSGDILRTKVSGSGMTHLGDTRVWQIERQDHGHALHVLCGGTVRKVTAKALILATGAREYVQPVPGWTTPGVIGLAGATAQFKQNLTLPGKRTVVAGTGPLTFFVAAEIRRLGGNVAAVVTPNTRRDWLGALPAMLSRPDLLWRGGLWVADLMLNRVPIYWGHAVSAVQGNEKVAAVQIQKLARDWMPQGGARVIGADSVCLGNGLLPAIEAPQITGLNLEHRPELGGWVPKVDENGATDVQGVFLCGDGAGVRGAAAAEFHGELAGLAAAAFLGLDTAQERATIRPRFNRAARFGMAMTGLSTIKPGLAALTTPDTIVCRCESLSQSKISAEIASGAGSTNAVKSGLRAGMGACGGKFCQTAVARMIANAETRPESEIVPPTPRPPLRPVPVAALAGDFDYDDLPIPNPAPL